MDRKWLTVGVILAAMGVAACHKSSTTPSNAANGSGRPAISGLSRSSPARTSSPGPPSDVNTPSRIGPTDNLGTDRSRDPAAPPAGP